MAEDKITTNRVYTGTNRFLGPTTYPAGSINDVDVGPTADIGAEKLEHQYLRTHEQAVGVDNADETRLIHVVWGLTGEILGFRAGNQVAASSSDTTTVDLKVNGVSVLSAVITLNAAATTVIQNGTIASADLAAGDRITIVINATGSTPGEGVFAQLIWREKAD